MSKDKLSKSELFYNIIAKMNRDKLGALDIPDFPRQFHVVEDNFGRKAYLEELPGKIVAHRDRDAITDAILRYCWEKIPHVEGAALLAEDGVRCRNLWASLTPPLAKKPIAVAELSEEVLTFKRLPFDAPPSFDKVPQHFETMLARMSNPYAVCAFIGSLFYPESNRQQYLYLRGDGGDGKGALMRFLATLFGDAATSLTPPGRFGDKFWNFNIYGKRLGLFFDCADWGFFGSPHFKSLTGGDYLNYEEKGRTGFTGPSSCKFIAASNDKPNVSSQDADMRRLIYIECQTVPREQQVENFENLLQSEAKDIVGMCKSIYLRDCKNHGPIPVEKAVDVALESESRYLDLFSQYFEMAPDCSVPGSAVMAVFKENGIRSTHEMQKVKGIWERNFGVKVQHLQKGTIYRGMAQRAMFAVAGVSGDE
jgi:hypothetical protein